MTLIQIFIIAYSTEAIIFLMDNIVMTIKYTRELRELVKMREKLERQTAAHLNELQKHREISASGEKESGGTE
jgi:hypothetical protein